MIDVILLAARIGLVALLFLFLTFAATTGVGHVRGRRSKGGESQGFAVTITEGPRTLVNTTIPISAAVVIGRAPNSDIVVSDDFVSGSHARLTPVPGGAVLEDLGSTNGTLLNGAPVSAPAQLRSGDTIRIGTLALAVHEQ